MSSLAEEDEPGARRTRRRATPKADTKKHWIGCLFTSYSYGRKTKLKVGKDPPDKILSNTRAALEDLRKQVEVLGMGQLDPRREGVANGTDCLHGARGKGADGNRVVDDGHGKAHADTNSKLGSLYACKFNSGSFGVEWEDTRALIDEVFEGSERVMRVVSPSSQMR